MDGPQLLVVNHDWAGGAGYFWGSPTRGELVASLAGFVCWAPLNGNLGMETWGETMALAFKLGFQKKRQTQTQGLPATPEASFGKLVNRGRPWLANKQPSWINEYAG